MELGIYETLITEKIRKKLSDLDSNKVYIFDNKKVDGEEATHFITLHLSKVISETLKSIKGNKNYSSLQQQIQIANNLLTYLEKEIDGSSFKEDLIEEDGKILEAVFDRLNTDHRDLNLHLAEIMPVTRLSQSELFTGGNSELSLVNELKREIRSSNKIDLLVSFIKWKAIVILKDAFEDFTNKGGELRVITTTYMGASDAKAIEELSKLPNTTIKVSYNTSNERLHAKAYLFYRKTGYHTGYIGSSNFSRSALTDGLEWNVKVTTKEIPHIIDKFQKTFESYWNQPEFELFDGSKIERLTSALNSNKIGRSTDEITTFFDLTPYHYQKEILQKIAAERSIHNSHKNLVVAATGTGKTMIAAFDFKRFKKENPNARLLFIAHRIEILKQALKTFRNVLKDQNFGELLGDGYKPTGKNVVFATVQSFNQFELDSFSSPEYYDFIIMDEAHHGSASSYKKIIKYFTPQILLGLTATPERMDGQNILEDFNHRIAAEIRLPDALNNKLLTPFQYFGITDAIDYSRINWNNGRYDITELNKLYTSNDIRVNDILKNLDKYTRDIHSNKCVGFCASIEHAKFMHAKFDKIGLKSNYLVSENSSYRDSIIDDFKKGKINYLFVVDIFNEGIDIPEIDTVLFLRPTESLTIFLQQLGRGLRLSEDKDVLTVLDFVGHARDEYNFEHKFRALIGKTTTSIENEIKKDFPHLPLGSSIVLEKKAKEYILENIKKATTINKRSLINKLQLFKVNFDLPLTLKNFLSCYNLELSHIYKNHTFTSLLSEAFATNHDSNNEVKYKTLLSKKLMATNALHYFQFIQQLIDKDFKLNNVNGDLELNKQLGLMFYYDYYSEPNQGNTFEDAISEIGKNKSFVNELREYLELRIDQIDFEEIECLDMTFNFPLKIHARYTREQILVALQISKYDFKSPNKEGVALNKTYNTEALFINLKKSEEDFSPTTMYNDYAINESLFHWESQNGAGPDTTKGRSYIQQREEGKIILLFVRETHKNEKGYTNGYSFLGPANFVSYQGAKPMSIHWKLEEPIPPYLWNESAKLVVG